MKLYKVIYYLQVKNYITLIIFRMNKIIPEVYSFLKVNIFKF